jgi:hypothetical protein
MALRVPRAVASRETEQRAGGTIRRRVVRDHIKGETMAVGIRTKLAGVTAEQFEQVRSAVNPEGNPPEGLIFHASGPIDGGWGVIDFWESSEHHQRFVAERVMPAMAAAGATGAPDVREFEVHEHFPH